MILMRREQKMQVSKLRNNGQSNKCKRKVGYQREVTATHGVVKLGEQLASGKWRQGHILHTLCGRGKLLWLDAGPF